MPGLCRRVRPICIIGFALAFTGGLVMAHGQSSGDAGGEEPPPGLRGDSSDPGACHLDLAWKLDEGDAVRFTGFGGDGGLLAFVVGSNTVRVRDTGNWGLQWEASMPGGHITSFATAPDGRRLALGNCAGMAGILEVQTGELLHTFPRQEGHITSVTFSPGGQTLLTRHAGGEDVQFTHPLHQSAYVRCWDRSMWGQPDVELDAPRRLNGDRAACMTFSPDGEYLALGRTGHVSVYRASDWEWLKTRMDHLGYVSSVTFSLDGRLLASGGQDHTIRVWDTGDFRTLVQELKGHTGWVSSLAFTPDGSALVSGSYDDTIRVWDVGTGEELQRLDAHERDVNWLAFSPDGRRLASASDDGTIGLWEIGPTPQEPSQRDVAATEPAPEQPAERLAFDGSGRILLTLHGGLYGYDDEHGLVRLLSRLAIEKLIFGPLAHPKTTDVPMDERTLDQHEDQWPWTIQLAAWSPDRQLLSLVLGPAASQTTAVVLDRQGNLVRAGFLDHLAYQGPDMEWSSDGRELLLLGYYVPGSDGIPIGGGWYIRSRYGNRRKVVPSRLDVGEPESVRIQARKEQVGIHLRPYDMFPGGERIAGIDQKNHLVLWDRSEEAPELKVKLAEGAYVASLAVGPAGDHIALLLTGGGHNYLVVVTPEHDVHDWHTLPDNRYFARYCRVCWSPNGSQIVVVSVATEKTDRPTTRVMAMGHDGTVLLNRVLRGEYRRQQPIWAPGGNALLVTNGLGVWRVDTAARTAKQIAPRPFRALTW